jgi:hypothetical protein
MVNIKFLNMTIGERDRSRFPTSRMNDLDVLSLETVLLNEFLNCLVCLGKELVLTNAIGVLPRFGSDDSVNADGIAGDPQRTETVIIDRYLVFGADTLSAYQRVSV